VNSAGQNSVAREDRWAVAVDVNELVSEAHVGQIERDVKLERATEEFQGGPSFFGRLLTIVDELRGKDRHCVFCCLSEDYSGD